MTTPSHVHDADGDGFLAEPYGTDCDDADARVHPGAADEWYDGVDHDCDGRDDFDADVDGWRDLPWGIDCDDARADVYPGAVDPPYDDVDGDCAGDDDFDVDDDGARAAPWGLDCDDTDADVGPGAPDEPYDGIDADCAGDDDFDADGDGRAAEPWGPDCDDTRNEIHPDALEVPCDLVDNDCDGIEAVCEQRFDDADAVYRGPGAYVGLGSSVALAGDLTGDGRDDLVLGAPHDGWVPGGSVHIIAAPLPSSGSIAEVDHARFSASVGPHYDIGRRVSAADDADGDGFADLWIASRDRLWLLRGPLGGEHTPPDAAVEVRVPRLADPLGLAGGVDATGDGLPDVLLGEGRGGSHAYLLEAPLPARVDAADEARLTVRADPCESWGDLVEFVGDTDGDGIVELLIGNAELGPACEDERREAPILLSGDLEGVVDPQGDAVMATIVDLVKDAAGAGDWNGDGLDDIAIGGTITDDVPERSVTAAVVVLAPFAGELHPSVDHAYALEDDLTFVGRSLARCDPDDDGSADLVVSAEARTEGVSFVHLVSAGARGRHHVSDSTWRIEGTDGATGWNAEVVVGPLGESAAPVVVASEPVLDAVFALALPPGI